MSNFIGVYPKLAPEDYCDRMVARLDELIIQSSGQMGQDANGGLESRKDVSRFFERDDPHLTAETNQVLDKALGMYIDEYPSLGMLQFYSTCVKVQRTPPKGGFHKWHCEHGSSIDSSTRCMVWMIYLNDMPEGEGTTEFIEQGLRLQPEKGTVVLFPASWTHTHRGNPVYTHDKYITTGWYYLSA